MILVKNTTQPTAHLIYLAQQIYLTKWVDLFWIITIHKLHILVSRPENAALSVRRGTIVIVSNEYI